MPNCESVHPTTSLIVNTVRHALLTVNVSPKTLVASASMAIQCLKELVSNALRHLVQSMEHVQAAARGRQGLFFLVLIASLLPIDIRSCLQADVYSVRDVSRLTRMASALFAGQAFTLEIIFVRHATLAAPLASIAITA